MSVKANEKGQRRSRPLWTLNFVDPLEPRDAFCSGHTNTIMLYQLADVDNGEQLRYYNFTSLYPYVNKNTKYHRTQDSVWISPSSWASPNVPSCDTTLTRQQLDLPSVCHL